MGLTMIMILAPPAGDAFNFVVNLAYLILRKPLVLQWLSAIHGALSRKKADYLDQTSVRGNIAIVFNIPSQHIQSGHCLVPPPGGADAGEFSFWYAAYVVTAIGCVFLND